MARIRANNASGGGGKSESNALTNISPYNYTITLPFHPTKFIAYVYNNNYYNSSVGFYYDEETNTNTVISYDSYSGWKMSSSFTVSGNTVTLVGSSTAGFNGFYVATE